LRKRFDPLFDSLRIGVETLPISAHAENWEQKQQRNSRYFFPHIAILQAAKVR